MYGAGPIFDQLLDRLHAMGCDPPQWGRANGTRRVWISAILPAPPRKASGPNTDHGRCEAHGDTLEHAARVFLDSFLTCSDKERDAAIGI